MIVTIIGSIVGLILGIGVRFLEAAVGWALACVAVSHLGVFDLYFAWRTAFWVWIAAEALGFFAYLILGHKHWISRSIDAFAKLIEED